MISKIKARPGSIRRLNPYPAGMASSRQTSTVIVAITTLVPSEAKASLVGLKTSPQYQSP